MKVQRSDTLMFMKGECACCTVQFRPAVPIQGEDKLEMLHDDHRKGKKKKKMHFILDFLLIFAFSSCKLLNDVASLGCKIF